MTRTFRTRSYQPPPTPAPVTRCPDCGEPPVRGDGLGVHLPGCSRDPANWPGMVAGGRTPPDPGCEGWCA